MTTDAARDRRPIILATDGSPGALAAMAEAVRLFADRPVVVVAVWRSTTSAASVSVLALPADMAAAAQDRLDAETEAEAEAVAQETAEVARAAGMAVEIAVARASGALWQPICRIAQEHDGAAIVVGSRGRGALRAALLGSVSSGVLRHCRGPVVVVRDPGQDH